MKTRLNIMQGTTVRAMATHGISPDVTVNTTYVNLSRIIAVDRQVVGDRTDLLLVIAPHGGTLTLSDVEFNDVGVFIETWIKKEQR